MTRALRLAGTRALAALEVTPDVVILDGKHDWLTEPESVGLLGLLDAVDVVDIITPTSTHLDTFSPMDSHWTRCRSSASPCGR